MEYRYEYSRPLLVISSCVTSHGAGNTADSTTQRFIHKLQAYIQSVVICPDRDLQLSMKNMSQQDMSDIPDWKRLIHRFEQDISARLCEYSSKIVSKYGMPQGFVFKEGVLNCPAQQFNIGFKAKMTIPSFIGRLFCAQFPYLTVETDRQMLLRREHFLIRIFTVAGFDDVARQGIYEHLRQFHDNNRLLIHVFNSEDLAIMEHLINKARTEFGGNCRKYGLFLRHALRRIPEPMQTKAAFEDVMKILRDTLAKDEINDIEDFLTLYYLGHISLFALLDRLRTYLCKYNMTTLIRRSLFSPYPTDLVNDECPAL